MGGTIKVAPAQLPPASAHAAGEHRVMPVLEGAAESLALSRVSIWISAVTASQRGGHALSGQLARLDLEPLWMLVSQFGIIEAHPAGRV